MILPHPKLAALFAFSLLAVAATTAQETFTGSFAEPADGGNLDVAHSSFDGSVAVLSPRWHESEALGSGSGARRWRNLLFAIRGVQGKIVTFRLPMQLPASSVMVHNMDGTTFNRFSPVWSYDSAKRSWTSFTSVERYKPGLLNLGLPFPLDSLVNLVGSLVAVTTGSSRKEDYGWEFKNTTPFTQDVVYISINEHYPVEEYMDWLESSVFTHPWVKPTASETVAGTFMIGYQSGAPAATNPQAFSRTVPDLPLYAFKIQEPGQHPTKLVMLVSGQHPYEGQNKAALRGAVEWILDPTDPQAAAYRSQYVTIVYPFVNPTGEYAGLWRGTAFGPTRDTNRHWNSTLTNPTQDRGIDTVIIHKKAMTTDVAALGLGTPYAVFDYHQNFGDMAPHYDYALHSSETGSNAYVTHLNKYVSMPDEFSTPTNSETLRGYWDLKGVELPVTFERSVYNTLASEHAFGAQTVRALAPAEPVSPPPEDPPLTPTPPPFLVSDGFSGSGSLASRSPDTLSINGAKWSLSQGSLTLANGVATSTNDYVRALIDAGSADAAVEANVTLLGAGSYAGLTLRASDSNNFLFFRIKAGAWVLGKVVGNTGTTLATSSCAVATSGAHLLRAECSGSAVTLSLDGVQVYAGTQAFNSTATKFGLSSGAAAAFSVDYFSVAPVGATPSPAAPPPPALTVPVTETLISDNFSGSGSLAGRTPDAATSNSAQWVLGQGTVTIANGVATSSSDYVRAIVNAGVSDATVSANIQLQASAAYAGLVFRASDCNNFLFFRIRNTGWVFGKVVGSTGTTLASGPGSYVGGESQALSVVCNASSISLSINGATVYTGSVATNQAATGFGLGSGAALPFTADNFIVTP